MNKSIPLFLYGTIILAAGVFLIVGDTFSFNTIKYTLGIGLSVGSIFAFISAFSSNRKQVQFVYHELHAFAMLIYGVLVLLFSESVEELLFMTSFLLMFYALSEMILCFWLFNLGQKVNIKIVFIRLGLGLLICIGTGALIFLKDTDIKVVFEGYGSLFILVGSNVLLYSPVMKQRKVKHKTQRSNNLINVQRPVNI